MTRRQLVITLLVTAVVLTVVAMEGVRRYASIQLVGGLADVYGGRVEADRAEAGWTQSTLEGVRFYDAEGEEVVASVKRLRLGLTLWELVTGETIPDRMALEDPEVTLRFGKSGDLLTTFPDREATGGPLPQEIVIQNASLVIKQEGRDPAEINAANLLVTSDGSAVNLAGALESAEWGKWQIEGQVDRSFEQGNVSVRTKDLAVTPELLRQLPLVPPETWEQMTLAGPVDAEIRVDLQPESSPTVHATVATHDSVVSFPQFDVQVTDAAGQIELDGTTANLRNLRGQLAGGSVAAQGKIDLAAEALELELDAKLQDVDLTQLPESLPVPEETSGRISGEAKLRIGFPDVGGIRASGRGKATIADPMIAGVRVEPIEIELSEENEPAAEGVAATGLVRFNVRLRDTPLRPLLLRAGRFSESELPDIAGNISTDLHVAVPLSTANDLATFHLSGDASSDRLQWEGISLDDLHAEIEYREGVLHVQHLCGDIPAGKGTAPGRLSGSLEADIAPRGDLRLDLAVKDAPLEIVSTFAELDDVSHGAASLNLHAEVPIDQAREVAAWQATGRFAIPNAKLGPRSLRDLSGGLRIEQGHLHLDDMKVGVADATVIGKVNLDLSEPYSYQAKFDLPATDVMQLARAAAMEMPEPVAGRVQAQGRATGTLQPLSWDLAGTAVASNVRVRDVTIDRAESSWEVDSKQVRLTALKVDLLSGQATGDITLPFSNEKPFDVTGEFKELQVGELLQVVPDLELDAEGSVSGSFLLAGRRLEDLNGQLKLNADSIDFRGEQASGIKAEATIESGVVDYQVSGDVLNGEFSAKGNLEVRQKQPVDVRGSGRVELRRIPLSRAMRLLNPRDESPLAGLVDFELEYTHAEGSVYPSGEGRLIVTDLVWGRHEIARRLESRVFLEDRIVQLPEIAAQLGSGSLRASASMGLEPGSRGEFSVALDRVPSGRLFAPWPELADQIEGLIDARLRGTLGSRIAGGGAVGISQVQVGGVDISGVRVPIQFVYSPGTGRGEVEFAQTTARIARGRVTGNATITLDRGMSLSGKLRMMDVQMRSLATSLGSSNFGAGRISGRADFSANNFESLDDLKASFDFSFAQTQSSQIPVFGDLSRYILPNVPSSSSFTEGEVRGRLANGVARIQRFVLTGQGVRVLADGAISLSGRLNLDVVALTGNEDPLRRPLVRRLVLPIIEAQAVPLTLLTRANEMLSDRIIYLRVGGTVQSPNVQVRAAPQLQYEALRFFLVGGSERFAARRAAAAAPAN